MTKYIVSANGIDFGVFEAADEQAARDLCAQDAGYKSEADMVAQLEQPSELVARTAAADFDQAGVKFGTVEHDGKTLALAQQAYADNFGTDGGVRYYAKAIDVEGNEYKVAWDTTAAWDATEAAYRADPGNETPNEDESEACDWGRPADVIAL